MKNKRWHLVGIWERKEKTKRKAKRDIGPKEKQ